MDKSLIAINPSFPQDSRAWPTQIKLHHISPLQTKYLTNTLSTNVSEEKGVIEIPSKCSRARCKQTRRRQKSYIKASVLTETSRCPKVTLALDDSSSPKAEGASYRLEIN